MTEQELAAHARRVMFSGSIDNGACQHCGKGASEEMKNHVYKSMSSRAIEMLKEDMDVLGPVRSKDVQKAQQEIVAIARKLESEGKVNLTTEEEEYVL